MLVREEVDQVLLGGDFCDVCNIHIVCSGHVARRV